MSFAEACIPANTGTRSFLLSGRIRQQRKACCCQFMSEEIAAAEQVLSSSLIALNGRITDSANRSLAGAGGTFVLAVQS